MIVDFSIAPIGTGESLSASVAEAFAIIERSGIAYEHHAMGTNLEGDWEEVMAVIKACRDKMLESSNRLSLSIKIDDRKGATDRIAHKVSSARAKMPSAKTKMPHASKQNPRDKQAVSKRFNIFGTACRLTPIRWQPFKQGSNFSRWPVRRTRHPVFPTSPSPASLISQLRMGPSVGSHRARAIP